MSFFDWKFSYQMKLKNFKILWPPWIAFENMVYLYAPTVSAWRDWLVLFQDFALLYSCLSSVSYSMYFFYPKRMCEIDDRWNKICLWHEKQYVDPKQIYWNKRKKNRKMRTGAEWHIFFSHTFQGFGLSRKKSISLQAMRLIFMDLFLCNCGFLYLHS